MTSGLSFSRYVSIISNTGDQSSIVVKEYDLDVDWVDPDPTALQYPGMPEQSYHFNLINTKANDLYYTIVITTSWSETTPVSGLNVPLLMNLALLNEDNSLIPVTATIQQTWTAGMPATKLYTQKALIEGHEVLDFCLRWDWGTTNSDRNYSFAHKNIDVKIEVTAEQ